MGKAALAVLGSKIISTSNFFLRPSTASEFRRIENLTIQFIPVDSSALRVSPLETLHISESSSAGGTPVTYKSKPSFSAASPLVQNSS
jgi:hypothetical protein